MGSGVVHMVSAARLTDFAAEAFVKAGVSLGDARVIAEALVEADLTGKETHGVTRVPSWYKMLSEGNMNPTPSIRVLRETPATALLDADNAVGIIACARAMDMAIEKAGRVSLGAVGVNNSTHCGALAYFPLRAAARGMIGFMTSNAAAVVPPYGSVTRIFATNPHCWAIPAGAESPVVLDMACTTVAGGKLRLADKKGEKIPPGWGLDRNGAPTDDPHEVMSEGFLQWLGGPKGFGLAFVADVLSGVMTGGGYGLRDFPPASMMQYGSVIARQGHFLLAIDVEAFMPANRFKERMDTLIKDVRSCKPAPGFTRVCVPGEQSFEKKARRLKEGIPIDAAVWNELQELRSCLGMMSELD